VDERLDARLRDLPPRAVHELLRTIAEIDEFKGWWRGRVVPDTPMLKALSGRVVDISAAASARIGGTGAPIRESERWPPRLAQRQGQDAAHILGYADVLRTIVNGHHEMQFGESLIQRLHAELLKYSPQDAAHRGLYKTVRDTHSSYLRLEAEPPALRSADPDLTPRAIARAADWANSRLASSDFHPLLVIAGFILELLAIRPFVTANGRISRIVSTFLLLRSGYTFVPYVSAERIIADRWTDYYFALRQSQARTGLPHPDISPWLSMFLDVVRAETRQLHALLDRQPDTRLLSRTQLEVLKLLARNREVTNRLVCGELGIPRETAKQVLNRLLALNLLHRVGAGRAVRYRKPPRLADGGAAR
jgi:Fic family protein